MLDTSDRQVLFFLMRLDDRQRNRAYGFSTALFLAVFIGSSFIARIVLKDLFEDVSIARLVIYSALIGSVIGTFVGSLLFKPKFRKWTDALEGKKASDPD